MTAPNIIFPVGMGGSSIVTAFDPEQIIVPASIRHGLGVFSCR